MPQRRFFAARSASGATTTDLKEVQCSTAIGSAGRAATGVAVRLASFQPLTTFIR